MEMKVGRLEVEVIRSRRKTAVIQLTNKGEIVARVPERMPRSEIKRMIREKEPWISAHLRKQERMRAESGFPAEGLMPEEVKELACKAKAVLPERVAYFARLLGVDYGRITIRHQKTRWGSCSAKGNLNFNCLLMLAPREVQDYVVVHELCHRKEMNHSEEFWKEVENILPDYKIRRKWLKEKGIFLFPSA